MTRPKAIRPRVVKADKLPCTQIQAREPAQ